MKKFLLIFTLLFSLTLSVQAQKGDKIYDLAEEMPYYPGGHAAMIKFLAKNFKDFENVVKEQKRKRKDFIVMFVIEKNGRVTDVRVFRKADDEEANKEAVRVVKKMRWKPAKEKGKKVRCRYTIRIA